MCTLLSFSNITINPFICFGCRGSAAPVPAVRAPPGTAGDRPGPTPLPFTSLPARICSRAARATLGTLHPQGSGASSIWLSCSRSAL